MTTPNTNVEITLRALQAAKMAAPYFTEAGWMNERTNDTQPHLQTKYVINVIRMADLMAQALAAGQLEVTLHGAVWVADEVTTGLNGRAKPIQTGNANISAAEIVERKAAKAAAAAVTETAALMGALEATGTDGPF